MFYQLTSLPVFSTVLSSHVPGICNHVNLTGITFYRLQYFASVSKVYHSFTFLTFSFLCHHNDFLMQYQQVQHQENLHLFVQKNMTHALEHFKFSIGFSRTTKAIAVENSFSGLKIQKEGLLPFPHADTEFMYKPWILQICTFLSVSTEYKLFLIWAIPQEHKNSHICSA